MQVPVSYKTHIHIDTHSLNIKDYARKVLISIIISSSSNRRRRRRRRRVGVRNIKIIIIIIMINDKYVIVSI